MRETDILLVGRDIENRVEKISQLIQRDYRDEVLRQKNVNHREAALNEIFEMKRGIVYLAKSKIPLGSKRATSKDSFEVINEAYDLKKITEKEYLILIDDKDFRACVEVGFYAKHKDLPVILGDYDCYSERSVFQEMGVKVLESQDIERHYMAILEELGTKEKRRFWGDFGSLKIFMDD